MGNTVEKPDREIKFPLLFASELSIYLETNNNEMKASGQFTDGEKTTTKPVMSQHGLQPEANCKTIYFT